MKNLGNKINGNYVSTQKVEVQLFMMLKNHEQFYKMMPILNVLEHFPKKYVETRHPKRTTQCIYKVWKIIDKFKSNDLLFVSDNDLRIKLYDR